VFAIMVNGNVKIKIARKQSNVQTIKFSANSLSHVQKPVAIDVFILTVEFKLKDALVQLVKF
jgi:hypothetical protein